jgi:hypothetical protein
VTFQGRCALVALPACSGHPGFYIGNEGLLVGCAPHRPCQVLLGAWELLDLRPSRGRHASGGSARLFAAMQDIWVSLHSIRSRLMLFRQLHRRSAPDIATSAVIESTTSSCDAPFKILLGILGYWPLFDLRPLRGRHAYKTSSRSALPDSLQLC